MRTYDTCRAEEIQSVAVGQSLVKPKDQEDDVTHDILHLVLVSGERRSILRSELTFAPNVLTRPQLDYPTYAQRQPLLHGGQVALLNQVPRDPAANPAYHPPAAPDAVTEDVRPESVYPIAGDYLVEDYDIINDIFVRKVYDAPTFNRYFKMSLN